MSLDHGPEIPSRLEPGERPMSPRRVARTELVDPDRIPQVELGNIARTDIENWRSPATMAAAAAEVIRGAIFEGKLRPGDQIPVEDIMALMGISRLPVREAVNSLRHEGLVRVEPYRGSFVGPFNEEILQEHWHIVGLLQGYAAARMAEIGDPVAIERLQSVTATLLSVSTVPEVLHSTFELPRVVNQAGGTELLRAIMRPLMGYTPRTIFDRIPDIQGIMQCHGKRVTDAIVAGDPAAAADASCEWSRVQGQAMIDLLRADGVFGSSSDGHR